MLSEKTMDDLMIEDATYDDLPFSLTATDRKLLATSDEDFSRITWNDLISIIANNTLDDLKRQPSDLRKYLTWAFQIKKQYGGITSYVIHNRLRWRPVTLTPPTFEHVSKKPFAIRSDYAVLLNDWPYGFAPGIAHILVWSKIPIVLNDARGDVTPETKCMIGEFVRAYFVEDMGQEGIERVLWFKNWVNTSVEGVDHIHVLVKDASEALLERWTERREKS